MRALIAAIVPCLLAAGCSSGEPTFRSEAEELAFLKTQSSPTLEQFRRIQNLEEKAKIEQTRREWFDRMLPNYGKGETTQGWLAEMAKIDADPGRHGPEGALEYYQEFLRRDPDSKYTAEIEARIAALQQRTRPASK